MEELRDGRTSSESTVLSYKALVFLRLSAIANIMTPPPTEYECLLETGRNGSLYRLYKLKNLPEEYCSIALRFLPLWCHGHVLLAI
jgi:hypothetical protein